MGEDVGKSPNVQTWGTPVNLHVTVPLTDDGQLHNNTHLNKLSMCIVISYSFTYVHNILHNMCVLVFLKLDLGNAYSVPR